MRSRVLHLSFSLALLFQVSDLSRIAYVIFELAPDCPVVGQREKPTSGCCDSQPNTTAVLAGAFTGETTPHPTGPSPRERSEKCPTCRMLATVHTFAALELPTPALTALETGLEQVSASKLPYLLSLTSAHARAPPSLA